MLKQLLVTLLVLLAISGNAQKNIDVLHYKFGLILNDNSDTIRAYATIKIKFLKTTSSFDIDLSKEMKVDRATTELHTPLEFIAENDKIRIILPQPANTNDSSSFIIYYHGAPKDGLIISRNKFGKRTFFADNWPNRAHNWIPCNDNPADKATFEFLVTAPSHYAVTSNGTLQEERELPENNKLTHWKEDTPLPTKIMVIGVADFAVDDIDTVNGVPVSSWVFKENKTDGFKDYSIAPEILHFFMDYIGPYPYEKLANVQSKTIFGGMENASAIFYSENSVNGRQDKESLFAHEIVHQWFGDMATEKNFSHLWLSEGFATYLTHIYIESKYGTDSLNEEMKKDRGEIIAFARSNKNPVVDSTSDFMELLNTNSYQKGGWILHMLRRQLGDPVFHASIRRYYSTYAGKNADTRDLQKIFEEVSGKDLSVFFQQWLYTGGVPELDIYWKPVYEKNYVEITVTQKQPVLYSFPLEIKPGKEEKVSSLNISQRTETFKIPYLTAPGEVVADPNTSLLAIFHISKKQ